MLDEQNKTSEIHDLVSTLYATKTHDEENNKKLLSIKV